MRFRFPSWILPVCLMALLLPAAASEEETVYVPEKDPLAAKRIEEWRDLKFGLLMHWGPYSQWGVVESWSICSEDEEWCRRGSEDYVEYKKRYENLPRTFNPSRFDPGRWARAAREAGMKYVVFTAKHHDGFCMFDSAETDYKITSADCPFSRDPRADVTREILSAFRREGLWAGVYFSKPDWHSEYYWWPNFATPDRNVNYDVGRYPERWEKFVRFTQRQIDELMSRYGRVDILWLDGGWVRPAPRFQEGNSFLPDGSRVVPRQNQDIRMEEIVRRARERQPGLIVVDRAVPGLYQNYLTPENTVPELMLPHPWESCIIMGGGWSFSPGARMKPARELIHLLADIVAKGGNLLLNIGPGPDGTWYPEAYERLAEIGAWLRINGSAIYGSRPLPPCVSGRLRLSRGKDGVGYAIVLAGEGAEKPPAEVELPGLRPAAGTRLVMLGSGVRLPWRPAPAGCRIFIPETLRRHPPCRHAWVIRLGRLPGGDERR